MIIKYLYNSYNLASNVSKNAASHVIEFNRMIDELPVSEDKIAYCNKINDIYMKCRWYMIGLYEASDRMLYSVLNTALINDKKRIEQFIEDKLSGKENENV